MARLAVDRIRTDGATQPRAAIHEPTVAEYAEAIEAGVVLPPVTVFNDGGTYWLADGFHRVAATKRIGCLDIEVDLRVGTRRDAMLHSFGANATHGLRRTNDDKRRAIVAMLSDPDWSQWSDREIGRVAVVSRMTVARVRSEMAPQPFGRPAADGHLAQVPDAPKTQADDDAEPGRRKVVRGDTEYEMNVAPINAARPKAQAADPEATLERDLALAEAEIGDTEVKQLREQLAEAHETIGELTLELETLSRGVDGDMATEIKKLATYTKSLERIRDDQMTANNMLKAEIKRLQRHAARSSTGGVASHG
jgi:hypothetical protein